MKKHHSALPPLLLVLAFGVMSAAAAPGPGTFLFSFSDPLTNPPPFAQPQHNMAAEGNFTVTGSWFVEPTSNNFGLVRVCDSKTGALLHTLHNPSPGQRDWFGVAVDISGSRVVVGAPLHSSSAFEEGIAYVFDLAGGTPSVPVVTLKNPSPGQCDTFGFAVAISGARVVVGVRHDSTVAYHSGSAYVYDMGAAAPAVPIANLNSPTASADEWFGWSVGFSGERVVVRAYRDNTGEIALDKVHVYGLDGATTGVPAPVKSKAGQAMSEALSNSVAVIGGSVVTSTLTIGAGGMVRGVDNIFTLDPTLRLTKSAPGFATLSWTPTNSPGFVLQYADSLAPANWLNAPSGAANPVTIATTNAARFYRMAQPRGGRGGAPGSCSA